MKKKKSVKGALIYALMVLALIITLSVVFNRTAEPTDTLTYSQVMDLFREGKVKQFNLNDTTLTLNLEDGTTKVYTVPYLSVFISDVSEIIEANREAGLPIPEKYDLIPAEEAPWWLSFIPYLLLFGVIMILWFFMMRQAGGGGKVMSFGKAKTRVSNGGKHKVTFADVAGAEEEKEELSEIVDFLKDPKKYTELGARVPRGVLLVGPPGTGKTYLAKAVAGEAGVPFLSISGSDFVEMYVGVGASRVRDLFDQAKRVQPSIVFIDEIDAVGRQRGAGLGGGHDEREQTLNQLLVEMDGFTVNEGVIIIAATNRPDILDSALLRPGRFDRQVYIGMPDLKARKAILEIHAKKKSFEPDVSFKTIAKSTIGFSPADLENLLNEAALLTARKKKTKISQEEIGEAVIKVRMGPEKKSHIVSEKEKRLTAYHETGHAIAHRFLTALAPVHQISIIPRGRAGGYTMWLPQDDKSYESRSEMFESIVSALGGRVAEALFLDDISTGASSDIRVATDTAREMVMKYGMSKLGPIFFGSENNEVFIGREFGTMHNYSENVAADIDREIMDIINSAYSKAESILKEKSEKVHAIAAYLMEHEKMNAAEFNSFFGPDEGTPAVDGPEADDEEDAEVKPADGVQTETAETESKPETEAAEASEATEKNASEETEKENETK